VVEDVNRILEFQGVVAVLTMRVIWIKEQGGHSASSSQRK